MAIDFAEEKTWKPRKNSPRNLVSHFSLSMQILAIYAGEGLSGVSLKILPLITPRAQLFSLVFFWFQGAIQAVLGKVYRESSETCHGIHGLEMKPDLPA